MVRRIQLNSVYLILKNKLRRKELDNLNNFYLKFRPELKIANFLQFCDSILIKF